ncbi:hypothetical protein AAC387_Pa07g0416 [Persea americana]
MDGRLFEVAIEGSKEMLLKLLEEDPPIDLDQVMIDCRGKDNPLHVGALYGHVEFVREILNRKPGLTRELNSEGQSPLHLASARGHVEVVEEILCKDADACFIRDQHGMIPLHLAAIKGRVQVLETLVAAKKATAFILTKSGEPILHLCANNYKFKALEKLVELVTDDNFVNMKDSDDNTILHVLSAKGESKVWISSPSKGWMLFSFFSLCVYGRPLLCGLVVARLVVRIKCLP